jgi:hypothetical protein
MLTLLAIVGISFVLVASSQAHSARLAREAESLSRPEVGPEAAFALFLGQLLYPISDNDTVALYSSLRGHDLARNAYGWWDGTNPVARNNNGTILVRGTGTVPLNDKPYSGTGRLHNPLGAVLADPTKPSWNDTAFLVNNTFWPTDGILLDPERLPRSGPAAVQGPYTGGWNVPYTYPDHNNFYLAMIDPGSGLLITPSFHREYLFGRLDDPNNSNWTNHLGRYLGMRPRPIDQLTAGDVATIGNGLTYPLKMNTLTVKQVRAIKRYIARQQAAGKFFPSVQDRTGDVKNLDGLPGGCDSIWIDINAPVLTTPDGLEYKMLVAPTILELDSRLNLNVVGNLMGSVTGPATRASFSTHRSHQGWGVWEVNPSLVLNYPRGIDPATGLAEWPGPKTSWPLAAEWRNVFLGPGRAAPPGLAQSNPRGVLARIRGRYDNNGGARKPLGPSPVAVGNALRGVPRGWGQVDYNGMQDNITGAVTPGGAANPLQFPAPTLAGSFGYLGLPHYPGDTFNNGGPTESANHAEIYNVFQPVGGNRALPIAHLAALLRFGGTGSDMMTSDLLRLMPNNLVANRAQPNQGSAAASRRNLVTLHSCDLDRPGATPFVWGPDAAGNPPGDPAGTAAMLDARFSSGLRWTLSGNKPIGFPRVGPYPQTGSRLWAAAPAKALPPYAPPGSEFDASTWRSLSAALGRLNLNRPLTDYPAPAPDTGQIDLTNPANVTQVQYANHDRQQFANDIFTVLYQATGALGPTTAYKLANQANNPNPRPFQTLRYLAQIAVNIVDYIDSDGSSTAFNWFGTEYVYGVELPRLVLNETYVQYDNDTTPLVPVGQPPKVTQGVNVRRAHYNVNVWVELFNPLIDDSRLSGTSDATARLQFTGVPDRSHPYRILLCRPGINGDPTLGDPNAVLRRLDNPEGDPNFGGVNRTFNSMAPGARDVLNPAIGFDWGAAGPGPGTPATIVPAPDPLQPAPNRFGNTSPFTQPVAAGSGGVGFWVIGPRTTYRANLDPRLPTTYRSAQMTYAIPANPRALFNTTNGITPDNIATVAPTIVLQRLANPALPLQDNKAQPFYNPYLTVDVAETGRTSSILSHLTVWDGRAFKDRGPNPGPARPPVNPPTYTAIQNRYSFGRTQPFAGINTFTTLKGQMLPPVVWNRRTVSPFPQPRNTFFKQNTPHTSADFSDLLPAGVTETLYGSSGALPFDWLVHMDRVPISTMELLHVADCKPSELTQLFIRVTSARMRPQGHVAPWTTSASARLHRFLEFVQAAHPRSYGVMPGGRTPGKVNLNMAFHPDLFRAVCDAQGTGAANDPRFTPAQVTATYQAMLGSRSPLWQYGSTLPAKLDRPDLLGPTDEVLRQLIANDQQIRPLYTDKTNPDNFLLGAPDNPMWGLSLGFAPSSNDAMPTLNSPGPTGAAPSHVRSTRNTMLSGTFSGSVTQNHDYQKQELLRKIFNSTTTRSNVFAVWLTVGYFEVARGPNTGAYVGDQSRPVKLGPEVGKSENRAIRHRMFAIIDRTNMQVWPTNNHGGTPTTMTRAAVPEMPIVGASNTGPIVITSPNHNLPSTYTGNVIVKGVRGNPAANGAWPVTVTDLNSFALNGSEANGDYTGGGTWARPGREARVDLTVMAGPTAGNGTPIVKATNPSAPKPIQITTSANHGLVTGQAVFISGVAGNVAANNSPTSAGPNPMHWTVKVIDTNSFTLSGSNNPPATLAATRSLGGGVVNLPWQVQPGSVLTYEPNTSGEETVVVKVQQNAALPPQVQQDASLPMMFAKPGTLVPDPTALYARFALSHQASSPVISRGNPGPWPRYHPRDDPAVVRYFALID